MNLYGKMAEKLNISQDLLKLVLTINLQILHLKEISPLMLVYCRQAHIPMRTYYT